MSINHMSRTSVLVLIGALSLAGCAADSLELEAELERESLTEVTVSFQTRSAAAAAAAALEGLNDGSLVLSVLDDGASFDALATDAGIVLLADSPKLLGRGEPADELTYDKDQWSCVGHCGEATEVCACDYWCFLFGDCCPDYHSVCE